MKRALISPLENNRIAQIEDEDFPVAEPLHWVDVADDTTTWDTWDGTQVVKYVEPVAVVTPPSDVKQLVGLLASKNVITAEDASTFDQGAVK